MKIMEYFSNDEEICSEILDKMSRNLYANFIPEVTPNWDTPQNVGVALYCLEGDIEEILMKEKSDIEHIKMYMLDKEYGKLILEDVDLKKIEKSANTRKNFLEMLDHSEHGWELSKIIHYSMSNTDLARLALIHRDNPHIRKKVEELLEDCNFHYECGFLAKGDYSTLIK